MVTRPALPAAFLCLLFAFCGFAKTPTKAAAKKPVAAKVASSKAKTRSAVKKTTATKTTARRSTARVAGRSSSRNVRYTRRYAAPVAPGSERIRLVQQALIERGHLTGEPTGIWDAASVEGLKKFETENSVKADGKLDSKMLILLGLGPKYQANVSLPGDAPSVAADDEKQDSSSRLNN